MASRLWVSPSRAMNICNALSLFLLSSYWYNNTCLFPDMGTVFIAIDKTDVENGCLKVCTTRPLCVSGFIFH